MSYINVCVSRSDSIKNINDDFQAEVNKKISEGYKPIGGVSHVQYYDGDYVWRSFSQAMYKSDP